MRTKNQRKTVIVHPRMQARVVLATSIPMFTCLITATLAEFLYFRQVRLGVIESDGTIFGMPEERLGMLLLFVSAASVQLAMGLLTSQKVAGTAYRIRQVLDEFQAGDREARVRLRKADYQLELADDVNGFLDWVSSSPDVAPGRPTHAAEPERSRAPGAPAAAKKPTNTGI